MVKIIFTENNKTIKDIAIGMEQGTVKIAEKESRERRGNETFNELLLSEYETENGKYRVFIRFFNTP